MMYIETLKPIVNKVPSIAMRIRCSGVGICGDVNTYKELNNIVLYENSAAVLTKTYKLWDQYIKNNIISINTPDYGHQIFSYK